MTSRAGNSKKTNTIISFGNSVRRYEQQCVKYLFAQYLIEYIITDCFLTTEFVKKIISLIVFDINFENTKLSYIHFFHISELKTLN